MPHRLNENLSTVPTIKELRGLIAASDAYDMDNVYFTEEGWVYRHYKKADKSVWWDEIISAGQVDVVDSDNAPVISTVSADVKLGTTAEADITFETGDGKKDYEADTVDAGAGGGGGGGGAQPPATTIGGVTIDNEPISLTVGVPGNLAASIGGDDTVTWQWKKGSGSGNVTFGAPTSATTTVTVDAADDYTFIAEATGSGNQSDTSPQSETSSSITASDPAPATPDVTLTLTGAAAGNSAYQTSAGDNGGITATVGQLIAIVNNSGGHPVDIRVADGGATVTEGTLTGAPANNGETVTWDTSNVTVGTYYYQCTSHPAMIGTITIS